MRWVNVANFEARAIAGQAPGSESRKTPLVRQFRQRIDLIHELRKLAAAKEIPDDGRERLRIDELLRRHAFDTLIEQIHALFDQAFGAGQTDAALVGEQFAHRSNAAAAEVID